MLFAIIKMGERINFYRIRIISLIFLVVGIVLISGNITGNAILDYTLSDYCRSDLDCINGKICCNIYGSPGFCNDAKICSNLEAFSMNLRESPLKKDYPVYINIGFIFIISSIIIVLFIYLHDKKFKKRKPKRNIFNFIKNLSQPQCV
jgi:hypothetical protein